MSSIVSGIRVFIVDPVFDVALLVFHHTNRPVPDPQSASASNVPFKASIGIEVTTVRLGLTKWTGLLKAAIGPETGVWATIVRGELIVVVPTRSNKLLITLPAGTSCWSLYVLTYWHHPQAYLSHFFGSLAVIGDTAPPPDCWIGFGDT
jgi:hypothetical protein